VLILALQTAVTVSVDQRAIRLNGGQGLLIFPFQFHHYLHPEREDLRWLFVTFDMLDGTALQQLRLRPFALNQPVRQTAVALLEAYLAPDETDLAALHLSVLLTRISRSEPILRRDQRPPVAPELIMQVNKQAQKDGGAVTAKEMARSLGISPSHLRARFRASIGVSPARHMRRMRLEKACGMLRLGQSRVTEIAELCGFNSIYSFSRAFRTAYGVSPMAFRRGARPARRSASH
jgi:AraC-like DNA-binding protein